MDFGWINGINLAVLVYLLLINIVAAKKGLSDRFSSKYPAVNILEQIGRYAGMALMILPIGVNGWKFGFSSVAEMLLWIFLTILLLFLYGLLWFKKACGGTGILYGLAIVPTILFLLNGILLRHPALTAASLIFGISHFQIVRENDRRGK